jgi:2-polyprenyl-6-methoxyphenol hydroxylase-like FAD-dependent oxidoreductase
VIILGGGPIGLLCAIEAATQGFREVCLIEKRPEYTRLNVPILRTEVKEHLRAVTAKNTGKRIEPDFLLGGLSFKEIEPPLLEKALFMGVKLKRPCVVTHVRGSSEIKFGRFKHMVLTLNAWDQENKRVNMGVPSEEIKANLLIVATGAGAALDSIVTQTLGFGYEKLKPENYMALGIFDHGEEPDEDPAANEIFKAAARIASQGGICFKCGDYQYLLSSLSGITSSDFKLLKQSQPLLQELVIALKRASVTTTGAREEIKKVQNNVFAFAVNIQRARQMVSDTYPAVLVGDAAVTPHPDTGSGVQTGFRGFEEFRTLLEALKTTGPVNDGESFLGFNTRYEKHVSEKALDGTKTICENNIGLLESYRERLQQLAAQSQSNSAKEIFATDIKTCGVLIEVLEMQRDAAKRYSTSWEPWNQGPGMLWERMETVWGIIQKLTGQKQLLEPQLAALQQAAGWKNTT